MKRHSLGLVFLLPLFAACSTTQGENEAVAVAEVPQAPTATTTPRIPAEADRIWIEPETSAAPKLPRPPKPKIVLEKAPEPPRAEPLPPEEYASPVVTTRIASQTGLARLKRAYAVTLQWISWVPTEWGRLNVSEKDGLLTLAGEQVGNGRRMELDGKVAEVGDRYFLFDGTILIDGHDSRDDQCLREGKMRFEAPAGKRYYRLQDREACHGLTDYVDIYF